MRVLAVAWLIGACGAEPAPHPYARAGYPLVVADPIVKAAPAPDVAIAHAPPEPFLGDVTQLSVGPGHVCAVTTSHAVVCWGDNAAGQLGVGRSLRSVGEHLARPHVVGGLPSIASVAAGPMHTCALDLEGNVYCWGSAGGDFVATEGGASGSIELHGDQLGTPVKMPLGAGAAHLVALSTVGNEACAAFEDDIRCWTTMFEIPINAQSIAPPKLRTVKIAGVTAMALGHGKGCAVTAQGMSCWSHDTAPTPAKIGAMVPAQIAIGEMYACVVSTTGDTRCWWSLIDDFWKKPPNREVRWRGKRATRAIAVGDSPVCTVDDAGALDCFLSDEGGLTDSAAAESWAGKAIGPHPIVGVDHAIEVGAARSRDLFGYGFGCALRESRNADGAQVFCWGDNESGELGNGAATQSRTAVAVLGATTD
jgi:hypothetical protein